MPKSRIMGAGLSSSSAYKISVNGNQGGGNKKGGLPGSTGLGVSFALRRIKQQAYSSPEQRKRVYCINQLGGIGTAGGRPRRHVSSADGVKDCAEIINTGVKLPSVPETFMTIASAEVGPLKDLQILFISDLHSSSDNPEIYSPGIGGNDYNIEVLNYLVKNPLYAIPALINGVLDSNHVSYLATTDNFGQFTFTTTNSVNNSANNGVISGNGTIEYENFIHIYAHGAKDLIMRDKCPFALNAMFIAGSQNINFFTTLAIYGLDDYIQNNNDSGPPSMGLYNNELNNQINNLGMTSNSQVSIEDKINIYKSNEACVTDARIAFIATICHYCSPGSWGKILELLATSSDGYDMSDICDVKNLLTDWATALDSDGVAWSTTIDSSNSFDSDVVVMILNYYDKLLLSELCKQYNQERLEVFNGLLCQSVIANMYHIASNELEQSGGTGISYNDVVGTSMRPYEVTEPGSILHSFMLDWDMWKSVEDDYSNYSWGIDDFITDDTYKAWRNGDGIQLSQVDALAVLNTTKVWGGNSSNAPGVSMEQLWTDICEIHHGWTLFSVDGGIGNIYDNNVSGLNTYTLDDFDSDDSGEGATGANGWPLACPNWQI